MNSLLIIALISSLWITPQAPGDTVTVEVIGSALDARFQPAVVQINLEDVIRFVVREGLHTVTAYHPHNRRPLRIPDLAAAFDSGLLKKGDVWYLTISSSGVYDFFCLPHERMGHVGRIISGSVERMPNYPEEGVPQAVIENLNNHTMNLLIK